MRVEECEMDQSVEVEYETDQRVEIVRMKRIRAQGWRVWGRSNRRGGRREPDQGLSWRTKV